jgi:hypothetical protein
MGLELRKGEVAGDSQIRKSAAHSTSPLGFGYEMVSLRSPTLEVTSTVL